MNRQDQLSSLVLFLIGLFIITASFSMLKIGSLLNPGPGLFPGLTGFLLIVFSLAILLRATFGHTSEEKGVRSLWAGLNWPKVLYTTGVLLIYAIALNMIGFLIMTLLLLIFLLRIVEPKKWKLTITVSILASVISYLIFDRILQVQLPRGFIGF